MSDDDGLRADAEVGGFTWKAALTLPARLEGTIADDGETLAYVALVQPMATGEVMLHLALSGEPAPSQRRAINAALVQLRRNLTEPGADPFWADAIGRLAHRLMAAAPAVTGIATADQEDVIA